MKENWYEILILPQTASLDEIKKQYHFLCHVWHPDKFSYPMYRVRAEERMKMINAAYAVLSDPRKRADYDAGWKQWWQDQQQQEAKRERDRKESQQRQEEQWKSEKEQRQKKQEEEQKRQQEEQSRQQQAQWQKRDNEIKQQSYDGFGNSIKSIGKIIGFLIGLVFLGFCFWLIVILPLSLDWHFIFILIPCFVVVVFVALKNQ